MLTIMLALVVTFNSGWLVQFGHVNLFQLAHSYLCTFTKENDKKKIQNPVRLSH